MYNISAAEALELAANHAGDYYIKCCQALD